MFLKCFSQIILLPYDLLKKKSQLRLFVLVVDIVLVVGKSAKQRGPFFPPP